MSRPLCQNCLRPHAVCLCAAISLQKNQLPVLILQHPDELKKPLGTAKLITLGLSRSRLYTDLIFDESAIQSYLARNAVHRPVLVYPKPLANSDAHFVVDFGTELFSSEDLKIQADAIILLDGTWRNTRELLHRNPWLWQYPTVELTNTPASRYRIRKAQQEGAVATIEAVALMLSRWDSSVDTQQLLAPFEKMIDLQISKMSPETFYKNYPKTR